MGSWASFISVHLLARCCCSPPLCALTPRTSIPYPRSATGPSFRFLSVSLVLVTPKLPFIGDFLSFSFVPAPLTPHMFHPRVSHLFEQPESLPSASLLHLPCSLDPSAFYYQPHYLGATPRFLLALQRSHDSPQAERSCYTIFYCVFTTGHNYY